MYDGEILGFLGNNSRSFRYGFTSDNLWRL